MRSNVSRENKYFQNQIHRSAPLSPRDEILINNKESILDHQTLNSKEKDH
jgi:hypothetical protein